MSDWHAAWLPGGSDTYAIYSGNNRIAEVKRGYLDLFLSANDLYAAAKKIVDACYDYESGGVRETQLTGEDLGALFEAVKKAEPTPW